MRTLRDHLVGLPLQKSVFARLGDAGPQLGVPELEVDDGVALADDGRLLVADGFMSRTAAALCDRSPESVRVQAGSVRVATSRLETATERTTNGDPLSSILAVGAALRSFIAIPILGKAVTDALLARLRDAGFEGPAPHPRPSPGLRLTSDLVALGDACARTGWSPEEIAATWPEVPEPVRLLVESFAADHVGFGPMPWDAPGWEHPAYVVSHLVTIAGRVRRLPDDEVPPAPDLGAGHVAMLYDALAAWLEATERGLVLVRRAFYVGIRPQLVDAAAQLGTRPSDLLFVTFDELATSLPSPGELADRREAYVANRSYLETHGVDVSGLEALVVRP